MKDLHEWVGGVDILVSEVIDTEDAVRMIASDPHFPPQDQKPLAAHIRHNHLSPEEVGKMATKAGVKMVVLTQIAPGNGSQPDAAHYSAGRSEEYTSELQSLMRNANAVVC